MAPQGYRYSAFISYSQRDDAFCRWLHRALETYALPKSLLGTAGRDGPVPANLYPIFRDRDELPVAGDLGIELRTALGDSACLVVICSPHAARSPWVDAEVRYFKSLGRADRVFPIILSGEPGSQHEECFPPGIRFHVGTDGSLSPEAAEPLAADARANKDGRDGAMLKLVAGILKVDFAELVRRDQERRIRRLRIQGMVAGLISLLFAGLAGLAYYHKRQADQRERIASSRQLANQARLQLASEPDLSLLLSLAALNRADTSDARGSLLAALQGAAHLERVYRCPDQDNAAVALSPDAMQIACGTEHGRLHLVNLTNGSIETLPTAQARRILAIAYAPDSRWLAVAAPIVEIGCQNPADCATDRIMVIDRRSGKTVINQIGRDASTALLFSPDSRWLYVGKQSGQLLALPMDASLAPLSHGGDPQQPLATLALAPDGSVIAGSRSGVLRTFRLRANELTAEAPCALSSSGVTEVQVTSGGALLVRRQDASLAAVTNCQVRVLVQPRGGPPALGVQAVNRVAYDAASGRVAYAQLNEAIQLLEPADVTGDSFRPTRQLAAHRKHVIGLWSIGSRLLSVDYGGKIAVWNLDGAIAPRAILPAAPAEARRIAFSPDGKHLAGALRDGRIALWDTSRRGPPLLSEERHQTLPTARASDALAAVVAFSPDGKTLVSGGVAGELILWDAATLRLRQRRPGAHDCGGARCLINALAWHPTLPYFASAGRDQMIRLWHGTSLTPSQPPLPHAAVNSIEGIAFSPDGRFLASAADDKQVRRWPLTGDPVPLTFPDAHARIADAALRSVHYVDQTHVLSTGFDGTILLWDSGAQAAHQRTGGSRSMLPPQIVRKFDGGVGELLSATVSPMHTWLVAGSNSAWAYVWDYASGRPLQPLIDPGQRNSLHVQFSPQNNLLAVAGSSSASQPAPITLWQMDVELWRRLACAKVHRELTDAGWKQYVGAGEAVGLCGVSSRASLQETSTQALHGTN